MRKNSNPGLFPAIVSDSNTSLRGLIADTAMCHGQLMAIEAFRHKVPFSLMYFFIFGKAPRPLVSSPACTFRRK
jgi:hypothetical protein